MTSGFSRRALLKGSLAVGVIAATGPVLSACGTTTAAPPAGGGVALPTYQPTHGLTPDLPGTTKGVQAAFFNYPNNLVTTVHTKPGSGKPITAMAVTYAPPVAVSAYRNAVDDAIGVPIDFTFVTQPDYGTRFATVTAGGALPDLIQIPQFANLPLVADFLRARCLDLSDHLSSGAVARYPNLAAIPTASWRNARVGGRIYGVPVARNVFNRATFYRKDIVDARGIALPTSADEFLAFCKELTDQKAGRYAIGGFASGAINPLLLLLVTGMFGVPNQWRKNADGSLTHYVETPEFTAAVAYTRKLWQAGVFHPDTPSMQQSRAQDLLGNGTVAMHENGNPAWTQLLSLYEPTNQNFELGALKPFGHNGGGGTWWLQNGSFSYTAINAKSQSRVDELLGVLNYCAAPFGSKEYDLLKFGVPGVHSTRKRTGPVLTAQGHKEVYTSYQYLAVGLEPLFDAAHRTQFTEPCYAWEKQIGNVGVEDPTVGLYSATASRRGNTLNTMINDEITSVVVGRKDISSLQTMVQTWRSGGGDTIRKEYEQADKAAK
jgi:putative aldouronate transport system substrate-binding protein